MKANGVSFTYVKVMEGTTFKSGAFNRQYSGAANMAYYVAPTILPIWTLQAVLHKQPIFVANGGKWQANGRTLLGTLDIEYNSKKPGPCCCELSQSTMNACICGLSGTYHSTTSCYPVIYTTTNWWELCTDNAASFQNNNLLWIACWGPSIGTLPAGYGFATFWQYTDSGKTPCKQGMFNGDSARPTKFAKRS